MHILKMLLLAASVQLTRDDRLFVLPLDYVGLLWGQREAERKGGGMKGNDR